LKELGVDIVQLTLFGTEEDTDYFRGRKGAYREHMQAIDILLKNEIVPRIQIFPFSTTIDDIHRLNRVLEDIRLEERVNDMGNEFSCFLNTPMPIGQGFNLENIRLRESDLGKLPNNLIEKTLKHYKSESADILWKTEGELLPELLEENNPLIAESVPLPLGIDPDLNVYPIYWEVAEWWCLGNVREDGVGKIIDNLINRNNPGLKMNYETPVSYFAKKYGKPDGEKLYANTELVAKWFRIEAMNNSELNL
jgi:MoaA/NifB/PqqE/SkfB family radical SAM enzyme